MRHKHADLIKRWAEDTTRVVEYWSGENEGWIVPENPIWNEHVKYRIRNKHQDLIDQKAAHPELIVQVFDKRRNEWRELKTCSWLEESEYRLVEPEKKKVEMWQWVVKTVSNNITYMTNCFYSSAEDVSKSYRPNHFQIVQRADWTRIEVEA